MFPCLLPGRGLTLAGRAVSPALKLPGCLFSLVAMSSGARGLLKLKAERGQAGAAGGRPPRRRQKWWWETWDVALVPWDCSHPSGEVQVGSGGCSVSPIRRAGSGTAHPASGWARTVSPTVMPARRALTTAPRWLPSPTGQCRASGGGFAPKQALEGSDFQGLEHHGQLSVRVDNPTLTDPSGSSRRM